MIDGEIVRTTVRRHYPPDVTACIFWLKNRQREHWRDKVETGVADKDGQDVGQPMDLQELARGVAFMLQRAGQQLVAKREGAVPLVPMSTDTAGSALSPSSTTGAGAALMQSP